MKLRAGKHFNFVDMATLRDKQEKFKCTIYLKVHFCKTLVELISSLAQDKLNLLFLVFTSHIGCKSHVIQCDLNAVHFLRTTVRLN